MSFEDSQIGLGHVGPAGDLSGQVAALNVIGNVRGVEEGEEIGGGRALVPEYLATPTRETQNNLCWEDQVGVGSCADPGICRRFLLPKL